MQRPVTDRQAWERELREELPTQLAEYRKDLDGTPITFKGAPSPARVANQTGAEADGGG